MRDVQVCIIGGGVMGVSLAYHLGKAGWSDVVLVEKNDLTHGSTWHAAGLCTHFAHNPTIQELRAQSVRLYRDVLPQETGASCGFHASGAMRITRNPDRMDEFAHVAGVSEFTGYPLRLLSVDDIAGLHPLAQLEGLIGGIYEPDDGHVDPTLATTAMAQVARQNGVEFQRFNPVVAVRREADFWIIESEKETLRAKHVVNAAGTWCFEVGQMMGVNVPSVPMLHQYLVTDRIEAVAERGKELPMIRDPEESWYVRQERDGLILGPYERGGVPWSVDRVPPEFGAELLAPDLDRVEHIIEAAMARIPALADGGVKTVVNGPITFSPDANPLIGPAFGQDNCWMLTSSSMGVMEGGGAGWFLAHWMTHGAPPMDALAVDPRRFGQWADRGYRLDKAVECFGLQFGVHYPFEERPAARGKRLTPLHERMAAAKAQFGVAYGWERPNYFDDFAAVETFGKPDWFDAVATEVACVSQRVGVADLSVFAKFEVSGPALVDFLQALGSGQVPAVGRIGLSHAMTSDGGVAAEFTVSRLSSDRAYLTSAAGAEEMDRDLLRHMAGAFDVSVTCVSEEFAVLGVMGPLSRAVLHAAGADLADAPWLSVRDLRVASVDVRALRVSYVGELGWELHIPAQNAVAVYDAVIAAGEPFGIGHFGAYAMNSMRLEKGYRAWGADLTTERSPLEAGLRYLVRPDLRETLRDEWEMVLLELDGDVWPFYGHTVFAHDRPIGVVTSAAFGHRSAKMLALAYLRETGSRDGLRVGVLQNTTEARVLHKPPFDPENLRLKG